MFLLEKLPREEAKAIDEPMGIFALLILCCVKDNDNICLGSSALLNRTIAAKLQTLLSTPWMPPFTRSHKTSENHSQWALQVQHLYIYDCL